MQNFFPKKLRRLITLTVIIIIGLTSISSAQVDTIYFTEGFENGGSIPGGWTQEKDQGKSWRFEEGGHWGLPTDTAYEGTYNAIFQFETETAYTTRLITPALDLEFAVEPVLTFMHAQDEWNNGFSINHDELKVYYKPNKDSSWVFLQHYEGVVDHWERRNIFLPDTALTDSFYIAFEGIAQWGHGVLIDDVKIKATELQDKKVKDFKLTQVDNDIIPSNSEDNPILKLEIAIEGNQGSAVFDSIAFQSLNTNDEDIPLDGAKLYYNNINQFNTEQPLDSGNFSNGTLIFDNLNLDLNTGYNYFWLTYDIKEEDAHIRHGDILDAKLDPGSAQIIDSLLPATMLSPDGYGTLYETVLYDDFEEDKGWDLVTEFQREKPQGLGGSAVSQGAGNPDPSTAFSGDTVLGTDLTGLGDSPGNYERDLSTNEYTATSPTFEMKFYRDIIITFQRWSNVSISDTSSISLSLDNGNTWQNIWYGKPKETEWTKQNFNLSDFGADYTDSLKIRFNMGPAYADNAFSGWNIDDFRLLANYLNRDVGVTEILKPIDGCGHTSADSVKVKVRNYGAIPSVDTIPLVFSTDGITFQRDTIFGSIPSVSDTTIAFSVYADLEEPDIYSDFFVATALSGDEDMTNDTLYKSIVTLPTHELSFYNDFETINELWLVSGKNPSWEQVSPSGVVINSAYSGSKVWMTNDLSLYNSNDSSFVEFPCFNLSEEYHPIVEFQIWYYAEEDIDGARLEYSMDNGESWEIVDTTGNNLGFDWYNSSNVAALSSPGWGKNTGNWKEVKCLLPEILANNPSVKFRMRFGSDDANNSTDGFAFDDFRIYNAPPDVGVDTILYPDKHCMLTDEEHVTISVKNFGLDTVYSGDSIAVAYNFNQQGDVLDTLVLSEDLPVDSAAEFTFTNQTVDLSSVGKYSLKAYTSYDEEITGFYNKPNNDTTTKQLEIYGFPTADLGPDIYTVHPDTLELSTPYDDYYSYEWQDGSNGNTFDVPAIEDVDTFYVTVTNDTTGCVSTDSIRVERLVPDIGFDSLVAPLSDCELSEETFMSARFTNYGTDTIFAGDSVMFGASANGQMVIDTFLMDATVRPDSSYIYSFSKTLDLSVLDTTYNLELFTKLPYDTILENDTLIAPVTSYGYPDLALNQDTTVEALSYTIDAGSFDEYLWEGGSTDPTLEVTESGTYTVTVTTNHPGGVGCSSTDSAEVFLWIHDLTVSDKLQPLSACHLPEKNAIEMEITNNGTDTLHVNDSVFVGVDVDETFFTKDTLLMTEELLPGNSFTYLFEDSVSLPDTGSHPLDLYTMQKNDMRAWNDTLRDTTFHRGDPNLDLPEVVELEALYYVIDPGEFDTYLWHDGTTQPTFTVNEENQTDDDLYSVSVTESYTNEANETYTCEASDTVKVVLAITDLSATELVRPVSDCHYPNPAEVEIKFTNKSNYPFTSGDVIPLRYKLNGNLVEEDYTLTETFNPDDTIQYTFSQKADISNPQQYQFTYFTDWPDDLVLSNDTSVSTMEVYGDAQPDLGDDSIQVSEYPITLNPGNFESYLWQDSSTNQTFEVTEDGMYKVIVTNEYGCTGEDSIYVEKVIVGIEDNFIFTDNYQVDMYPNPVNRKLFFDIYAVRNYTFTIKLFNAQGKLAYAEKAKGRNFRHTINTSSMAEGVYILHIITKEKTHARKLIIEH
jgi:hypothetical protein